ncbi:response regulator transcription factor [Clostridium paraputrificum]|uniref:response regulator transcription factor n=1 Tax=Clostridium TaxID=1485 RepID=UPI003D35247F
MEKRKILVVEDEFSINDTLSFALTREGFMVKSVFDGESALKVAKEFKPELVLLDLMLPDMSGFDICKVISKDSFVIMVTARDEVIDKILGMEIGADDYITKPFEIRELIARVKAIFRRIEKIEVDKINRSELNFKVNFNNRTVVKSGEEIVLKRKEFELVRFLYENRGMVFSREELLDKIWGYDYFGDSRTVDVHIRRLRASLGEDKDNSIIETVFGVGYVMR